MIPVLRPKLPDADAILPYLQQIDGNRWYSNHGPLVQAFEARLAQMCGVPAGSVTTAANGTLALTAALLGLQAKRGGRCLMPSWTFTATPAAALQAGLIPYFLDVDRHTQALTPGAVREALKSMRDVSAVIVVAPMGAPVDIGAWDDVSEETGIPVIIDAAACFDAVSMGLMRAGACPVMVSLHATKALGVGEGAFVITRDAALARDIQRVCTFGFEMDRRSHCVAMNAKMSEYTAAVGLAALDQWAQKRAAWAAVRDAYLEAFAQPEVGLASAQEWVSSTFNITVPQGADQLIAALATAGVETRQWWGKGCHTHPAYGAMPRQQEMPHTGYLAESVVGLPMAVDLAAADIARVGDAVLSAVEMLNASAA